MGYAKTGHSLDLIPASVQSCSIELSVMVEKLDIGTVQYCRHYWNVAGVMEELNF